MPKSLMKPELMAALAIILASCSAAPAPDAAIAAPSPDAESMFDLGMSLGMRAAEGQPIESGQAKYWLAQAASQDYMPAVHALGWLYIKGLDVKQDRVLAFQHFQRAALDGFSESQYMLGVMYGQGWGTEKSSADSLYWIREAARQGHEQAQHALKNLFALPSEG